MADANSNNLITSGLALINSIKARQAESTRISRDLMVPQAGVTGGTGDKDMRRFYDPVLQGQMLVQRGMNGWEAGAVAINMQPRTYEGGLPFMLANTTSSLWGQTMMLDGDLPFLQTVPGAATCGSGTGSTHQELYCPAPGSNWNVPPLWPGVKHDACASGVWGSEGAPGGSGGGSGITIVYHAGDPAPPNAPTNVYATKFDASTIQITWITGESYNNTYPSTEPDNTQNQTRDSGYGYTVNVSTSNTGPFSPAGSIELYFTVTISGGVYNLNTTGLDVVQSTYPSQLGLYFNYLFSAIPGTTYYFTVNSFNPSGNGPASSISNGVTM